MTIITKTTAPKIREVATVVRTLFVLILYVPTGISYSKYYYHFYGVSNRGS